MKALHMIAFVLVIVGGLNWGLVGLGAWMGYDWNLVQMILGMGMLANLVYILVGLSAVYLVATHMGDCRVCGKK